MKKIFLVFTAILFSVCAMASRAESLSTAEQHKLLADMAAETKKMLLLPQDQGRGVIWQDVYADKNQFVLKYLIKKDSDTIPLSHLEGVTEMMCGNSELLKTFQSADATFVILYKFNDKTITIEKPAKDCLYPNR